MDNNLIIAIVTSVCTAGSTAGVAIVALMLSNKRMDRIEVTIDRLDAKLDRVAESIGSRFNDVDSRIDLLTGAIHEIDKRLSIIEDRVGR